MNDLCRLRRPLKIGFAYTFCIQKAPQQRWKRVGENLVRYVPSGTIYAVFRVRGRKAPVRLSLETKDLRTAKGKLPEKRREAEQMDTAPDRTIFIAELVERYKETLGGLSLYKGRLKTEAVCAAVEK